MYNAFEHFLMCELEKVISSISAITTSTFFNDYDIHDEFCYLGHYIAPAAQKRVVVMLSSNHIRSMDLIPSYINHFGFYRVVIHSDEVVVDCVYEKQCLSLICTYPFKPTGTRIRVPCSSKIDQHSEEEMNQLCSERVFF